MHLLPCECVQGFREKESSSTFTWGVAKSDPSFSSALQTSALMVNLPFPYMPFALKLALPCTVEPRFNEFAGDRPNLFVKSRVHYIENLDITNLRENNQNVR